MPGCGLICPFPLQPGFALHHMFLWTLLKHKSLQSSSSFDLHLANTGTFLPVLSFGAHQFIKVLHTELSLLLLCHLVYVLNVKTGIRNRIYEDIYRNCGCCLWLGISWQFPRSISSSGTRAQPGSPKTVLPRFDQRSWFRTNKALKLFAVSLNLYTL